MNIRCPKCRGSVSETAINCTQCGHSFMVAVEAPAAQPRVSYTAAGPAPPPIGTREHPECATATYALIVSFVGLFMCGALAPVAVFLAFRARATLALNPGMRGTERVNTALVVSAITILLWAVAVARFSRTYFPAHHL